jgi:hypothetical protein
MHGFTRSDSLRSLGTSLGFTSFIEPSVLTGESPRKALATSYRSAGLPLGRKITEIVMLAF